MPFLQNFRLLIKDQRGATAVEYVLLASAVAGALAAIVFSMGDTILEMFVSFAEALAG
jgi:Flp pilus assembly pilin Flp